MIAHWPQYLWLAVEFLTFAIYVERCGEDRGRYSPVAYVLNASLTLFVLFKGGFFAPIGWAP